MVRTENRIRNGVEEHKHVGYIWWHPVSRVHDITYVPEILGGIGYFWSNVCEEVDQMKKTMIYYETCVITSYTTINRLFGWDIS